MSEKQWTSRELFFKLGEFQTELERAGLADSSVKTYVQRSDAFIRWLDGRFVPQGPTKRTRPKTS